MKLKLMLLVAICVQVLALGAYALDADFTTALTTAASEAVTDIWAAAKLALPIFAVGIVIAVGVKAFKRLAK